MRPRAIAFSLSVLLVAAEAATALPMFTDVSAEVGLFHRQGPAIDPATTPATTGMTGGAAAGDFDGDGWVDLVFTGTDIPPLIYLNDQSGGFNLSFTAWATPPAVAKTNGVAVGDIDNDGDSDLYITVVGHEQHFLYVNRGDGVFDEVAVQRGATPGDGQRSLYGTGVAFGDVDRDGYLDLYAAEWRPASVTGPADARLYRNLGASGPGSFEDVTSAFGVGMDVTSGVQAGRSWSFSPRFSDLDRDGRTDLAVAGDFGTSRLFWNEGGGSFSDGTAGGIGTGWHDMGFDVGDVDGDGDLDWFVTDIFFTESSDEHPNGNRLFRNDGGRTWTDITSDSGVRHGYWGWGAEMADLDNDGDLDIVHTNGFIDGDAYLSDPMRLFVNDGSGVFSESALGAGLTDTGQGRGLLTLDYDRDGDLDVLVVRNGDKPVLYRNDSAGEHSYLRIDLEGVVSNRDGLGAWITVTPDLEQPERVLVHEMNASSNYLSVSEVTAHFGLGDHVGLLDRVEVVWPSGLVQVLTGVEINQVLSLVEPVLAGDTNLDGVVDLIDLSLLAGRFGESGVDWAGGDFDRSLSVDLIDLSLLAGNFGLSSGVPEPVSGVIVMLGAVGLLRR
ncbi:MAG: FG-GAP-like repeat-containing protein [Phycisphaeraceae bacterium]